MSFEGIRDDEEQRAALGGRQTQAQIDANKNLQQQIEDRQKKEELRGKFISGRASGSLSARLGRN